MLVSNQSLVLRRAWSLTAGLLAGTAAVQAGLALVDAFELDGVSVLIPLTALPALVALTAAAVPKLPGAAIRRTAFGAGTVVVAAAVTAPLIVLAGWLTLRAAAVGAQAWSAAPGTRFGDLAPQVGSTPAAWTVALISLAVVGGCAVLAIRISGWPDWLRRSVQVGAATVGGFGVIVLPLVPEFPVVAVVTGLTVLSVLAAVLVVAARTWARPWLIAGWTASALTGTLAVLLAWSCRDLSVPFTALGIAGLLLARRRVPTPSAAGKVAGKVAGNAAAAGLGSAALTALAGIATPFAVGAAAGIAGAPEPQRVAWAGLVGGLSAAALIGLPRWLTAARPGRADWTGTDRLAAATPGLIAAVVGLLATLPDDLAPAMDGATWPRPALLAVILLVALTGTVAIRPAVVRAVPVLPLACAVAVTPLLGALAGAIRAAVTSGDPSWPTLSLLWALAAGVGAAVTAAVVLSGRADPNRRLAAEFGVIGTGLIGLGLVSGLDQLWPVLLVLGAAAAAIAATPDRQRVGWLAGLLLTGSTWSRLAVGNVTLVEAYSLPPACALLALALYRFYRDSSRDSGTPALDPVKALLPVATVGLVPSILVAARGPQARPAVLIAVAAVLVLAGWQLQRRDRLLLGATLTGIGVLTAAGTAVLRAGTTLSELTDQATAPLAGVEVWTVPAALVLLLAALTMKMIQPIEPLQRYLGPAASPPALAALLLAGLPTLGAALLGVMPDSTEVTDSWTVGRAAVVLGLSALAALIGIADRLGPDRFDSAGLGLVPGAITLTAAASWSGLTIGVGPIEAWTLPLAILLLIHGWSRFERVAEADTRQSDGLPPSWLAYAPGIAVLLLPSLMAGLSSADGSAIREIGLITLAAATVVVGAMHRLQAPILLGAGVLAVQAVALLAPWIAELSGAVPLWGWVAAVGLSLLLFGAGYEARMRQLRTMRLRLTALR